MSSTECHYSKVWVNYCSFHLSQMINKDGWRTNTQKNQPSLTNPPDWASLRCDVTWCKTCDNTSWGKLYEFRCAVIHYPPTVLYYCLFCHFNHNLIEWLNKIWQTHMGLAKLIQSRGESIHKIVYGILVLRITVVNGFPLFTWHSISPGVRSD